MGFFEQVGKNKKKEQDSYTEKIQTVATGQTSAENNELEKSVLPSIEERYISQVKNEQRPSEEETMSDDSDEIIVQDDPNIISTSDYLLRINETRMEVMLTIYHNFSLEELNGLLQENGVVSGIREEALQKLAQGRKNYEETLVATGTAAKDGRDGFFEYYFDPHPPTKPIILSDGTVDYNVLGKIELVTEGQHLATYHPSLPAADGMDVMGNTIEAYVGKEQQPLQCKRCEADESGSQYYANTEGNVTVADGCLTVTPVYVVKGNLGAATGNVDFHGDVFVEGNVYAGVTVKTTGNITVNGHVETAKLYAGKDVILKNGMQGSGNGIIRAGCNVMARFIEQTQVYAGNEINTGALMNCEVEAGNSVVIAGNRGSIIGGTVTAVEQITASSIGNRAGVTTQIVIGLDCEFKYKMAKIDYQIGEYQSKMMDAENALERIAWQLQSQPLTPELREQKAEQMRNKIHYQLKLKEITTKREQLIDINRRSVDGKVVVTGAVNAGCIIIINGMREVLHSGFKDVTFKKGRKEMRIVSNKW
ncbi:MAG: FapA family protein [Lachnospiraceae bacterium]|nr:FapA family protein [Lachnospiraceae bacterium]